MRLSGKNFRLLKKIDQNAKYMIEFSQKKLSANLRNNRPKRSACYLLLMGPRLLLLHLETELVLLLPERPG